MKLYEIRAVFFNRGSVEPLGSASGFQRFRRNRPKLSGTKFATTVRCGCNNIDQCFSTPSPRTHLSPRKALESVSTRGKQVCCNILTQQWLYQLHTIDIFVRTAIKTVRVMLRSDGVLRLGLETHFCESRSRRFQVSSRSRSRRFQGLETLNIANKWLLKFLYFNDFLFVVFAGKKPPKHVGKISEIWKKIEVRSDDDIFSKHFGKTHKFWSLESRSRTSNLESRSRSFW